MTRVLFPVCQSDDQEDFSFYRRAFEREGFRLAQKMSESLLLSSDAVLLYCNEDILLDAQASALLKTAADRGIPFVLVHESGCGENLNELLKDSECIRASKTDFKSLRTVIDLRKKEPFALNHQPPSKSRLIEYLLVFLTAAVILFFLIRISMFSQPEGSSPQTVRETVKEAVQDAVVRVYALGSLSEDSWRGSGFAVSPDGYIVTNAHVVDHASVRYRVIYSGQEYEGRLIAADEQQDIALLKIDAPTGVWLAFDEDGAEEGETIYAVGYPGSQKLTAVEGTALSVRPQWQGERIYEAIRMPLKKGISGSPVVSEDLHAVGIASAVSTADENLSYMVPADTAVDFLKDLIFLEKP